MRFLASVLLVAHGGAHLVGFLVPWGLLTDRSMVAPGGNESILGGRVTVGPATSRMIGIIWLALGLTFAFLGLVVWFDYSWLPSVLATVSMASLALTLVWWPKARAGALLNIVILIALGVITLYEA